MSEKNTGVGSKKASTSPTRSASDWDILGEESDHKNRREKEFKKQNKGEKETPQDLATGNEKRTNRWKVRVG